MAGRRPTMNWASAPDEGDAASASSDIKAFLAQRPERDWQHLLERMRDALTRICVSPLIRNDPVCSDIIVGMPQAEDMAALDAGVKRLKDRVDELVAKRAADRPAKAVAPGPTPASPASRRRLIV